MTIEIWLLISSGFVVINLCQMYFANMQDDEYFHTPLGIMIAVTVLSFIPIVQILVGLAVVYVSCSILIKRITGNTGIMDYYPGRKNGKHNV